MATLPPKWGCCALEHIDKSFIRCKVCKNAFHHECLGLESTCDLTSWSCSQCTIKPSEAINIDITPVRFNPNITMRTNKRQALQSPPNPATIPLTEESVRAIVENVMELKMNSLLEKITLTMTNLLNRELTEIREEVAGLRGSVEFLSNQYDDMLKERRQGEEKIKDLLDKNEKLSSTIKDMSSRLNTLEQHARASNVEIQCVPQKKTENLLNIVTQLGKTIGCDIKEESISNCTRVMKLNNSTNRPKSIVVQFATPRLRDSFLAASINFNKTKPASEKLNTSHLELDGAKSAIFVTEHLSPANKALHTATRLKAKEKGYRYVWIRGGRIYVKKSDDSDTKIMKDMDSLHSIL